MYANEGNSHAYLREGVGRGDTAAVPRTPTTNMNNVAILFVTNRKNTSDIFFIYIYIYSNIYIIIL